MEDDSGDPVEVGSCVLESSSAEKYQVKLIGSICFYKRVALGKFLEN